MHAYLAVPDCASYLAEELPGSAASEESPWLTAEHLPTPPCLAFARQALPDARAVAAASINAWADQILDAIAGVLPDAQPWRLHLWPQYGEGRAGEHRCALVRDSLTLRLKKRRRALLRSLEDSTLPLTPETSLVQAALTAPEAGFLSVALAPRPFDLRAIVSAFPAGDVPITEDKAAPSRAFTKLVESEWRLGERIQRDQTCVDLGASPGSWSYIALQRGARVIAVDRSPLRDDLMRNPRLRFHQGDAFKFKPESPVDWLICDIIAAPQRSIDLLLEWLRERRMRRFVVTIKFKGTEEYPLLDQLKQQALPLCADFRLTRLCANKNEVCAFGVV
ncbi:MAG: SAM-dependent methyltransferase [Prosthecobacter sp.]|nr:SAM-dependent methyltransferase [Prosthecobacter sp.]